VPNTPLRPKRNPLKKEATLFPLRIQDIREKVSILSNGDKEGKIRGLKPSSVVRSAPD
jgi:hypothetical protein